MVLIRLRPIALSDPIAGCRTTRRPARSTSVHTAHLDHGTGSTTSSWLSMVRARWHTTGSTRHRQHQEQDHRRPPKPTYIDDGSSSDNGNVSIARFKNKPTNVVDGSSSKSDDLPMADLQKQKAASDKADKKSDRVRHRLRHQDRDGAQAVYTRRRRSPAASSTPTSCAASNRPPARTRRRSRRARPTLTSSQRCCTEAWTTPRSPQPSKHCATTTPTYHAAPTCRCQAPRCPTATRRRPPSKCPIRQRPPIRRPTTTRRISSWSTFRRPI